MYTIGIFRDLAQPSFDYPEELVRMGHEVMILQENDLGSDLTDIDAIIIEESTITELSSICKNILKLRTVLNKLIWVILTDEEEARTKKKIYLQLGADGVSIYEEEFVLQFSNILKRIEDNNVVKNRELEVATVPLLELLPDNLSVLRKGKDEISLTKLEFKALELLLNEHDKALTYEEIYQNI